MENRASVRTDQPVAIAYDSFALKPVREHPPQSPNDERLRKLGACGEVEIVHHDDNYRVPRQIFKTKDEIEPMPDVEARTRLIGKNDGGTVAMIAASMVRDRSPPDS